MRYQGGKSRIAKPLGSVIRSYGTEGREHYLEPFLGGASVFEVTAPKFARLHASDLHTDLMLMWKALRAGWTPPKNVTKAQYLRLKEAETPSALRGYVGFAHGYGGQWFTSFLETGSPNTVIRKSRQMTRADLRCCDYREWRPGTGWTVYCDPPYAETGQYSVGPFQSDLFWQTMNDWVAPAHWYGYRNIRLPPSGAGSGRPR